MASILRIKDEQGIWHDVPAIKGDKGEQGVGIERIEYHDTIDDTNYFTIFLSNKLEYNIFAKNGKNGEQGVGIIDVVKTSSDGLTDYYTITLSDDSTYSFSVTNGEKGEKGDKGEKGEGVDIENGKATINADELYLGDRDVLREAQLGAIIELNVNLKDDGVVTWDIASDYANITENSIDSFNGTARINVSGKVKVSGRYSGMYSEAFPENINPITIYHKSGWFEGVSSYTRDNDDAVFSFTAEDVAYITVYFASSSVTFDTLNTTTTANVNGLMSAEDKQSLKTLETQIDDLIEVVSENICDETMFTDGNLLRDGTVSASSANQYSPKYSVKEGDILRVYRYHSGELKQAQFERVCAYNGDTPVLNSGANSSVKEFIVPSGINYVAVTIPKFSAYSGRKIMITINKEATEYVEYGISSKLIKDSYLQRVYDQIGDIETILDTVLEVE